MNSALRNDKVTADNGDQSNLLTGKAVDAAPDLANVIKKSMEMAAMVAPPAPPPD